MGFYFRKSKNFGLGRINLSSSGLGFSTGIKGFRVGIDSKGRTYISGGKGAFRFREYIKDNGTETKEEINLIHPTVPFKQRIIRLIIGYSIIPLIFYFDPTPENSFKELFLSYNFWCLYFLPLFVNVILGRKNSAGIIWTNIGLGWTVFVPIGQIICSFIYFFKKKKLVEAKANEIANNMIDSVKIVTK